MKKIIISIILTLSMIIPVQAYGLIVAPWNATSTDKGSIQPNAINGNIPFIIIPGFISTASSTIAASLFNIMGLSNGCLQAASNLITSTGSACGSGSSAPAFTVTSYGASTTTIIGFLNGLFTGNASTTFGGPVYQPALSQGFLYIGSNGRENTVASSSAGFALDTRTLTIAGTANQITSSAGAQNLTADRTWTLSFPNQVIFPQYASSTSGFSTVYASSTNAFFGILSISTTTAGCASITNQGRIFSTGVACGSSSATPGSPTNSIQYNNAGSFGGSATLTFNGSDTITFGAEDDFATIQAPDAVSANTVGGAIQINTGEGLGSGDGGIFILRASNGGATGNGGNMDIGAGEGGGTSGDGGFSVIRGGTANGGNGNGGDVRLEPGTKDGAGSNGFVKIVDPSSGIYAVFNTASLTTSDKTFTFPDQSGTLCLTTTCTGGSSVYDWLQENSVFGVNALTPTTTIPIVIKSTATSTFVGGIESWTTVASKNFIATSTVGNSLFAGFIGVGPSSAGNASRIYINSSNGGGAALTLDSQDTGGTPGRNIMTIDGASYSSNPGTHTLLTTTNLVAANRFSIMDNGRIRISTSTTGVPATRVAISSGDGDSFSLVIGSSTATNLTVASTGFGTTTVSGLTVSGSATSTSNVGWNITTGCYAIGGVCLSTSGSSGITSYDAWTHPVAGQSATTSLMLFNGQASSTQLSATQAYFGGTATTTFFTNGQVGVSSSTPWGFFSINPISGIGNPKFVIGSSTATSFLVASNGNVGIATTTPPQALSVAGDMLIGGSGTNSTSTIQRNLNVMQNLKIGTDSIYLFGNSTSTFTKGIDISGGCFAISGVCLSTSGSSNSFAFPFTMVSHFQETTAATTTALWVENDIYASSTVRAGDGAGNTGTGRFLADYASLSSQTLPAFAFHNATNTGMFAYDSEGTVVFGFMYNGVNALSIDATSVVLNASDGVFDASFASTQSLLAAGTGTLPGIAFVGDEDTGLFSGTNVLGFSTGGSEKARIDSSGLFDLGTTTGNYKSNIFSATLPQVSLSAGGGLAQWTFRNAGGDFFISTTTVAGTATTTKAALAITNGGAISISTSTAGCLNVNTLGLIYSATCPSASGITAYDAFTHSTVFLQNSATTSKIGIGTTTPYYDLTVASSTGPQIALSTGTSGDLSWVFRNSAGNFYLATTTISGIATSSRAALSIEGATTTLNAKFIKANTRIFSVGPCGNNYNIPTGGYQPSYLILDGCDANQDTSIILSTSGLPKWEIGSAGDTHFTIKSAAGTTEANSAFTTRFDINHDTGQVGFGTGVPTGFVEYASSSGSSLNAVQITYNNTNPSGGTNGVRFSFTNTETNNWFVGTDAGQNRGDNFYISDGTFGNPLFMTGTQVGIFSGASPNSGSELSITGDTYTSGTMSVASTVPWGTLSVVSAQQNFAFPAVAVATSTNANPLFMISATSTPNKDFARMAVGTTTMSGYGAGPFNLFVQGAINSTKIYIDCVYPTGIGALTGDGTILCGSTNLFDEDGQAATSIDANSATTNGATGLRMWAGATAATTALVAAGDGGGLVMTGITTNSGLYSASSSPIFEAVITFSATNASSSLVQVGMGTAQQGTDFGAEIATGYFFVASSTKSNWIAVAKENGVTGTNIAYIDTGIASTTTGFGQTKMTISVKHRAITTGSQVVDAQYFINGKLVAQATQTSGSTHAGLAPFISIGASAAGLAKNMYVYSFKTWWDDLVNITN